MPTQRTPRSSTCALALAALALVVSAFGATTASAARTAHRLLTGQTGPGFTITLKQGKKSVKTLKAGVYRLKVLDKSAIHNFHITGPGVNRKTSVAKVGTTTWTVRFKKGTYRYVCDPHKTIMRGSFKVT
jgi:plastocyanin